ncbi:MAG: hypothetical protein JWM80_1079 [Cyanobacteria bacterium RYN_339]|nr:hypothetical protein [Cyanobacteria bacterium RYN_339]
MWKSSLVAATILIAGCGLGDLLFPMQAVELFNQSSVTVTARIGKFAPGGGVVTAAQALQTVTLAPSQGSSLRLATGHYSVYAEAQTPQAEGAHTELQLTASAPVHLVLNERAEDHLPQNQSEGHVVRTLGWSAN